MYAGALWTYDKENLDVAGGQEPAWIGIGFITADLGGLLLLIALILGGIGLRAKPLRRRRPAAASERRDRDAARPRLRRRRLGDGRQAELDHAGEPVADRLSDRGEVGAEAVVRLDLHHLALRPGRRDPERVARALDDEHRDGDGLELGQAARRVARASRRPEREREAEDARGAGGRGRAAGDPRARGAAAGDDRQPSSRSARSCSRTAVQAASSWWAGAGERRPATR